MNKPVILTGIKPTGTPHLGNYIGAIKPAIEMSTSNESECFFFIADYHALTTDISGRKFGELTREVAATWLAFNLNPDKITFYKQSDIPEIFTLLWILSCMTPKGLMNRAHAYKAILAENEAKGVSDIDSGVNMGLFNYPVLMAADILLFNTDVVPVGKDQLQHIEIARDIAIRFNNKYGNIFKIPMADLKAPQAILPGIDGRKMSKSYGNTIPLFSPENRLRKLINGIKTDSLPPEAPKDPETSSLFLLFKYFSTIEQVKELRELYLKGVSWGKVKEIVFDAVNATLTEPRKKYNALLENPKEIDEILANGANRARKIAGQTIQRVQASLCT